MSKDENLNEFMKHDSKITSQTEIDYDQIASEKHFRQIKLLDEKIADNMLKLNIVLFISTIILSVIFIFYSSNIFYIQPIEIRESEYSELTFSLIGFTVEEKNNTKLTNQYTCISNFETCENKCKSIDLDDIRKKFDFECKMFSNFAFAGIIVRII
jgi:hypothetical protein